MLFRSERFTLEQLRTFVTVVETGSFSAAARKMGKAQSAISLQIQNLELDLNLELFDRGKRYPTLTQGGRNLLDEAEYILQRTNRFKDLAEAEQNQTRSHLVIAADELVLNTDFDNVLKRLSDTFPNLTVEVKYPVLEKVRQLLEEGIAHLGISVRMNQSLVEMNVAEYSPSRMCVVCAATHPLTRVGEITASELSRHKQILVANFKQPSTIWQASPSSWRAENIWGAKEMCKAGVGWAVIPYYAVKQNLVDNTLVCLESADNHLNLTLSADILWPRKIENEIVIKWLVNALKQCT